ncbi:MAG: tetratricopeptide repeat protein [Clostridiales bacterium]|nr:tetratricopeptide repeat protein [Clostridiales bacterium]
MSKNPQQEIGPNEEPVFYEESGGVTKAQAIEIIQGLAFSPDQSPMGVAGGDNEYGIVSYPNFVLIFFNQDSEHPMQIKKRAFMPLTGIMADVHFYTAQGDFEAAAACIIEGIERNQNADENWRVYCTAGEVFWRLREMELAGSMFMKAYQCKDCDQKAHVLCQAAATYCILQEPDAGFALYHKALEEEPGNLEALHDLGGFHWDMGELDQAAGYYFSVLKKEPAYYASYEELANLFDQLGNTVWPGPFMDCFQQKHPLQPSRLEAAEADMQALLAKL